MTCTAYQQNIFFASAFKTDAFAACWQRAPR